MCLFWWYKALTCVSEGSQMGHIWVVYHPCLRTRSLRVWEMLQMGNFSSWCIEKETEENEFVSVVESVARGAEGSQMGHRWVIYHSYLWKRSQEVWEILQMENCDFHFSSRCIEKEAEENAFVLMESVAQGVWGFPDGSQMGDILFLPLEEVARGVGDVTDGKFWVLLP